MFVLAGAAGGEFRTSRMWISGIVSLTLLMWRITRVIFDFSFETAGFWLGRLLFCFSHTLRMIAGLSSAEVVVYLSWDRPWWFMVACLALVALDLFAFVGHTLHREPRLLLMPWKGFAIVSATLWGWGSGWILAIAAYLVVRRAFLFVLYGLTISAAEALQGDRDRSTAAIFERLKSDNAPEVPREPIILYLRPFNVTGRIKLDEGKFLDAFDGTAQQDEHDIETKQWKSTTLPLLDLRIGVQESVSLFEQNSEFEMYLEQALRGAGHFIALGRPGETLGAGRLPSTEEGWRDSVALLIDAATLCIVIPSAQPGTQWEIRHIVQSAHLEKCCILMPPAIGQDSHAQEWNAARAALLTFSPCRNTRQMARYFDTVPTPI